MTQPRGHKDEHARLVVIHSSPSPSSGLVNLGVFGALTLPTPPKPMYYQQWWIKMIMKPHTSYAAEKHIIAFDVWQCAVCSSRDTLTDWWRGRR